MKLISCHINRFGAISERDFSFDRELTGILGENGAGKSTLAAFLSAMFYGLKAVRKGGATFNDREHFRPFGGGSFGGTLLFESDAGDRYRIERIFDEKSAANDKLTVYKNDVQIACDKPGEDLFGVDEDAFSRTVFLSAETLDPEPGQTIADRLCETVSTAPDSVPAKKAVDALDAAARKIVPARGNGELYRAQEEAQQIETELRAAQAAASALPALKDEYRKTEAETKILNACKLWASYDELQAQKEEAEKRLALSNARFANGVPDDAAITEAESKIALRERLARDAETPFAPTSRQAELVAKFEAKRPNETALSEMESKAKSIRDAQATAIPAPTAQNPTPAKPKGAGWAVTLAAAGGGLTFLAGLILLILSITVPGAILLAAGVIGLGTAAVLLFQGKVSALEKTIAVVDPGGAERARRMQLDADLAALLSPYGYSSPDGALAAFADLKRDLEELRALEEERAEAADRRAGAGKQMAALDFELATFFSGYGIDNGADYRAEMNALREAIRDRKNAAREVEKAKLTAATFAERQGLTERPESGSADPGKLDALKEQENLLLVRIHAAERTANEAPELEEKLAAAEERVLELRGRHARLVAARDLLAQAQENLVRRYVDPVKDAFVQYADALASFLGKSVSLDPQFNLSYEEAGAMHSYRHLSDGEKTVAALCLRMALADCLYEGKEQPPLVLDDPLVHLDADNLARAVALLRQVAKRRQLLCLTCHPSRAV